MVSTSQCGCRKDGVPRGVEDSGEKRCEKKCGTYYAGNILCYLVFYGVLTFFNANII